MTDDKPVYRPPWLFLLTYVGMIGVIWYWGGWKALAVISVGCVVLVAGLIVYGYWQRYRDGE